MVLVWTDYMKYRAKLRGFELAEIEAIVRFSIERYFNNETGRRIVIGHHGTKLVMVAYEADRTSITPITIHATSRQQIRFRIRTRRYTLE